MRPVLQSCVRHVAEDIASSLLPSLLDQSNDRQNGKLSAIHPLMTTNRSPRTRKDVNDLAKKIIAHIPLPHLLFNPNLVIPISLARSHHHNQYGCPSHHKPEVSGFLHHHNKRRCTTLHQTRRKNIAGGILHRPDTRLIQKAGIKRRKQGADGRRTLRLLV